VVPSLDQTTSESYVWAYPGCPVRILLSLNVIEQLQAEVSQSTAWRGEIGGLLIRSKKSKPGTIRIVDFIPLPGEQKPSDPHFKLSSGSLAEAIARCPSDSKIVGYYRTDVDQRVHLRAEDLDTIQQWFKDPASVFLVIAPASLGRPTAGFFFWENGAVTANPSLTFPFDATKLVTEGWPTQAESQEKERFATFTAILLKISDTIRQLSIPAKIGILSALFALVVGIRIFTWNRAAGPSKSASSPSLGLQVRRDGTKFFIAWNQTAPPIRNAKDANLVIWDSSRQAWDGSSEPLYMPLTQAQLRAGSVTYTSFSFTEKVKFRLDTVSNSGDGASESMVSVSPLSISSPSSTPTLPAPETKAENLPPYEPRHSVPVTPLRSSARPVRKRFVPPQSVRTIGSQHENVMPDPPNLVVEVVAGIGFQPGAFHPNGAATPAPPPSPPVAGTSAALNPAAISEPVGGRSREGVVTITSEPSGAKVEINAVPAGVTPLTLQITPVGLGFTVTVTKNGFMKWMVQSFSTAQPYSLHAQLRENPK
jgi:hypothetical protein